ncbi:MAG: Integral membrane protein [Candidatus Gottesmanbacteria bacterium GW2011_GWC2_39_8]|uniref:Integral membrane protein n=1 Tax=Candidatus Gottesmanbacteria bacterium GW2011_GWC2_39_8 TaxID=1618450 RepID=A0A0G0PXH2_9BACT|nr:MAG: Integral membrane protein [Candidatus Gottesmanbacteria bacterium GW2011_GWC2_39_8]
MMKIRMNKLIKLAGAVFFCESVGILGSLVTLPSMSTWYGALNKPSFNPPNFIFGPVWTSLYFLMGVSLFLVLDKKLKSKKLSITRREGVKFFVFQLVLNFLWSFIFFYMHLPLLAFFEIVILWMAIMVSILKFQKISKPAAYLLVPYIFWVSFAAILNLFIVILN